MIDTPFQFDASTSANDIIEALRHLPEETREAVLSAFESAPKSLNSNSLSKKTNHDALPLNAGWEGIEVIKWRADIPIQQQFEAITRQQEPANWSEIETVLADFEWTEADEKVFWELD
jgi:hypothetical protein